MNDLTFKLVMNGKDLGRVKANDKTTKEEFVRYVRETLKTPFDGAKDALEIIRESPPPQTQPRHPARDKSPNNKLIDQILDRHVKNLLSTYGEARLFKLLADVHGLVKPETKAG